MARRAIYPIKTGPHFHNGPAVLGTPMAETLGNMQIGGAAGGGDNTFVSQRFRAVETGQITSFRFYNIVNTPGGYSGGTLGTYGITLQTDDGSANHFPSGTVLATTSYTPVDGAGQTATFASPPSVTVNQIYHLVFTNTDPSPIINFASIDNTFIYGAIRNPHQPGLADQMIAVIRKLSTAGAWNLEQGYMPIMDLTYADGGHQGLGYIEANVQYFFGITNISVANPTTVTTSSNHGQVGTFLVAIQGSNSTPSIDGIYTATVTGLNTFTVPVNVTVLGNAGNVRIPSSYALVSGQYTVRQIIKNFFAYPIQITDAFMGVRRVLGNDPITITVLSSTNTPIGSASSPAAGVPVSLPDSQGTQWVGGTLSNPYVLTPGAIAYLQLTAPATSIYTCEPFRAGMDYNYQPVTYYGPKPTVESQFSLNNGASWASCGRLVDENDFQFYIKYRF